LTVEVQAVARIVKIEGRFEDRRNRFFSEIQLQADPALVAEGWERRFTTDAGRIEEVTELYARLGYEVRAEPVEPVESNEGCEDCHSAKNSRFKTIYTRMKRA
jgi:hypothetical protein